MAKNKQPVLKRARALGIEPGFMGIDKQSKRNPNQSRRKKSEYAVQLNEKQKVKFVYGLLEKQFRNTFEKAQKRPGSAGANLLIMLERRFDNVVYRMGFAATRREARQLVSHAHFTVNGGKVDIPSYLLKAGDVVAVKDKSKSTDEFKAIVESNASRPVPAWVDVNKDAMEAKVVKLPERDEIATPVEEHLIVEFYSK